MLHICYQYNDNSNKTHSKHSLNFVNVGSNDSTKTSSCPVIYLLHTMANFYTLISAISIIQKYYYIHIENVIK